MKKRVDIAAIIPRLVDGATAAAYVGRGQTKFREQVRSGDLPGPSDRNGNVDLWDLRILDRYVDQRSGLRSSHDEWDD
ncbi:MAG: hypothetical protein AB7E05_09170 [Sphingobium sp.]